MNVGHDATERGDTICRQTDGRGWKKDGMDRMGEDDRQVTKDF